MAHFAQIDENNKVINVVVVDNSQEHRGQEFLAIDCNLGGTWIQTSYNKNFRGKFAGVGDIYNPEKDRFETPQPFASWIWDEDKQAWLPPFDPPAWDESNPDIYQWNESIKDWVSIKDINIIEGEVVPPAIEG